MILNRISVQKDQSIEMTRGRAASAIGSLTLRIPSWAVATTTIIGASVGSDELARVAMDYMCLTDYVFYILPSKAGEAINKDGGQ